MSTPWKNWRINSDCTVDNHTMKPYNLTLASKPCFYNNNNRGETETVHDIAALS
jgi:hypothetical protein